MPAGRGRVARGWLARITTLECPSLLQRNALHVHTEGRGPGEVRQRTCGSMTDGVRQHRTVRGGTKQRCRGETQS
eukprot:scaffold10451_cov121-Isochrysis_galbana.AAC.11